MADTINLTDDPKTTRDTQANISPYDIFKRLWAYLEPYFEAKWKIQLTQQFPRITVDGPVIAWRILRRTPGKGNNKVVHGKGANFTKFVKSEDGVIYENYSQFQTIIFEAVIVCISAVECDEIAWAFENALIQASGLVQRDIDGFSLTFMEQIGDTNMSWRTQDDLVVRTCRFEAVVPITYTKLTPEINRVDKYDTSGYTTLTQTYRRTTDSTTFYIPSTAGRVVKIHQLALFDSVNQYTPLLDKVDYLIKEDENKIAFIEWITDGRNPEVGEDFQIRFDIAAHFDAGRIDIRNRRI